MFLALDDTVLMIAGIIVMLVLLASFLFAFIISQRKKMSYQRVVQQLREGQKNQLIEAAVRSEEIERHRIAEILHDEVGAILSSSKLHIQGIKHNNLDASDTQLFFKGSELLDEGIQKVRGISHNLHSNILKEFGLNEAIRHFVQQTIKGTLIKAETNLDDNYTTLNPEKDMSIYRMIQELLNNILKHSAADEINMNSNYQSGLLKIVMTHTGTGLTQQQFEELRYKKDGLGLKNIMNRIILLKGHIEFSGEPNRYTVNIELPVNTP